MKRTLHKGRQTPHARIMVELYLDDIELIETENHPIEITSMSDTNRTFMQGPTSYSVKFTHEASQRLYAAAIEAADCVQGKGSLEKTMFTERAIAFGKVGGDDEQGDPDR